MAMKDTRLCQVAVTDERGRRREEEEEEEKKSII